MQLPDGWRDEAPLAPCASFWRRGRGRLAPEPASPTRSDFQRDRDRIVHCTAFRRLAHKTQVFVPLEGDHFRTRLTHTIEVAQIARALARSLRLDEDLAEAVALSHDLGHTPFGHTGEDVLDECLREHGGFDHNAQALRIVTRLERRYAAFDGLNLTWETLEGLVKHNGPLIGPYARHGARPLPQAILDYDALNPLDLASFASAEAQCAALADDIAYDAHDLDDGLRANLFDLEDVAQVDFLRDRLGEIARLHPGLERTRRIHELGRRVITGFVEDVIVESGRRLAAAAPANVDALRAGTQPVVAFSPPFAQADHAIKRFLFERMYRHPRVLRIRDEASGVLRRLYAGFVEAPRKLPQPWAGEAMALDGEPRRQARVIADYIAGMTDRYALGEHLRLFGSAPELR